MGALAHLLHQHDARLVMLAVVVCLCGSLTAFRLYSRLRGSRGLTRFAWTLLTGFVAGAGAWATHFLALLAYDPGLRTGYWPAYTMASLMVAVAFTCTGFAVASIGRRSAHQVAGGVLVGFGLAAMHYVGMFAMVTEGRLEWDESVIGASVAMGVIGSLLALVVADRARKASEQVAGGLLLTLAIAATHFIGMSAMTVVPDPSIEPPVELLSGGVVTFGVASIAVFLIMGGLGAALIESAATSSALQRIRRLADAAFEGILVVLDGRINDCNAAFSALVGAPISELKGRRLSDIIVFDDGSRIPIDEERREAQLHPVDLSSAIPVEVFARLMDDGERLETAGMTVLTVRDLRERRAAEEKIRYLAEHDALTGLPNRNALQSRLAAAIDRVEASKESLALLCVDIDRFKEANDLHGHEAGDALLVEVARRLRSAVSAPSFAARLGADEFIVVQVAGGDQPGAAAELAGQILDRLREPIDAAGQVVHAAGSIGISLFPHDGRTGEALLANADMALFRAKDGGRGAYRFFKREMDETIRERRTVVRELRHAIEADQLELYYQPQARTSDGQVCGFEALVRWNHPERGLVSPGAFIPLAEESGLVVPLGEWALRRACAEAAGWERPLRVAVNLSPLQLHQPTLAAMVEAALEDARLDAGRLEMEVTESALFHDYKRALDNLWALKNLGVRIAMDDFGTGFSSLSTLQSFPFDKIKIDKSFVENIDADGRSKVIVRAILGLGRSLDIPVVAEGVETAEQIAFLRGESCSELQGYAIGKPVPAADIRGWTTASALPVPMLAARKRRSSVA